MTYLHSKPLSFFHQGEQLRRILQLQVLHAVLGIFAALLPFYNRYRSSVLHQILDGTFCSSTSTLPVDGLRGILHIEAVVLVETF